MGSRREAATTEIRTCAPARRWTGVSEKDHSGVAWSRTINFMCGSRSRGGAHLSAHITVHLSHQSIQAVKLAIRWHEKNGRRGRFFCEELVPAFIVVNCRHLYRSKRTNVNLCPLRKRKGSVSADNYVNLDRLNNNVRLKSWLEITLSIWTEYLTD
jgi:hypothetical protein